MVDIYIRKKHRKKAVNFFYFDSDDFKQLCLLKIWRYIDSYKREVNFYTFCSVKCEDVFRKLYAKESKKAKMVIHLEDMATEKTPLDCVEELSYTEYFGKE